MAPTKFAKGTSGNQKGRPKGIPDKRTELRDLFKHHAGDLIQKAVDLALSGDQAALRMCLDRICPTIKAVSEPVSVPIPVGTLDEQAAAVFRLATSGALSPDDGSSLINMIQNQCRIKELTDMESRLQALENQAEGQKR
jgi:hypothetical protein